LGTGGFAVVRKCKRRADGKVFALKVINKKNLEKDDLVILDSEVNIMRQVKHKNIVQLHDVFDSKSKMCLVLDLLEGGELFDRIIEKGHLTEKLAADSFAQIVSALGFLHAKMIVHRDLKPENLLYETKDDASPIKLIDFGLAGSCKNAPLKTPCGTPNYVAPEILRRQPYGVQSDMWSAGVILYIILCGFPPFYDENDDLGRLYRKIKRADFDMPSPYWDGISDSAKDLVKRLLQPDPKKRLTAQQTLAHPWLKEASDKELGKEQLFQLRRFQYIRRLRRGVRCILAVLRLIQALESSQ
jgi:calcium/calmodulin-dependent protein kinase I